MSLECLGNFVKHITGHWVESLTFRQELLERSFERTPAPLFVLRCHAKLIVSVIPCDDDSENEVPSVAHALHFTYATTISRRMSRSSIFLLSVF